MPCKDVAVGARSRAKARDAVKGGDGRGSIPHEGIESVRRKDAAFGTGGHVKVGDVGKVGDEGIEGRLERRLDFACPKDAVAWAGGRTKAGLMLQQKVHADVSSDAVRKENEVVSASDDLEEDNSTCCG